MVLRCSKQVVVFSAVFLLCTASNATATVRGILRNDENGNEVVNAPPLPAAATATATALLRHRRRTNVCPDSIENTIWSGVNSIIGTIPIVGAPFAAASEYVQLLTTDVLSNCPKRLLLILTDQMKDIAQSEIRS